jgi:hypothetical protein
VVPVGAHHTSFRALGKFSNFVFFIGWLCPKGKESLQFLFCSGQRLYNYVLLLSLPQREETLQFCFIGSDPKGRDFAILFYWLCPERRDLTNFVLLNLPREKRTLTFCFIESAQREQKLYNFILLALPREKRLHSFDKLGLPQREETVH